MRFTLFALILSLVSTKPVLGHEFWISPLNFQIGAGESIIADLRVGQKFGGSAFAFIPPKFARFDLVNGDRALPVEGRIGDRPALNMIAPGDGLWVIAHETTDSVLTYSDWSLFTGFVTHKDLPEVLETHAQRGLPQTGFRESYRRFAKALVAVGTGAGGDREVGFLTEIIAEKNPYVDDISSGIPVRVLYEGVLRVDAQVEVFEKSADGGVTIFTYRTDVGGRVTIPVKPGHQYLVDAVKMLRQNPNDPATEPVWRSLWASLTFAVPG